MVVARAEKEETGRSHNGIKESTLFRLPDICLLHSGQSDLLSLPDTLSQMYSNRFVPIAKTGERKQSQGSPKNLPGMFSDHFRPNVQCTVLIKPFPISELVCKAIKLFLK